MMRVRRIDIANEVTPCFRNEPVIDEIHKYCFMKLELFCYTKAPNRYLNFMINDAFVLFDSITDGNVVVETINNDQSDIIYKGSQEIELGSYLKYEKDGYSWICGTGLAEPRMSIVLDELGVILNEKD